MNENQAHALTGPYPLIRKNGRISEAEEVKRAAAWDNASEKDSNLSIPPGAVARESASWASPGYSDCIGKAKIDKRQFPGHVLTERSIA